LLKKLQPCSNAEEFPVSVVSNTTVLVNFAEIGQPQLLATLFGTVHIPTEVVAELQAGVADGYPFLVPLMTLITPPATTGWLHQTTLADDAELRSMSSVPVGLHRGEAACLAIARHRQWLFLSDDRAARAEARRHGIGVSGSIGCLVLAVDQGIVSIATANSWLATMVANGYYAPLTDLTPLIHGSTRS
jgi:predicted nucleic acid-binding protein